MASSKIWSYLCFIAIVFAAAETLDAARTNSNLDVQNVWKVTNKLKVPIRIHCHSPSTDLQPQDFPAGNTMAHDLAPDTEGTDIWTCHFLWSANGEEQYVVVWAKDNSAPYLQACTVCEWEVQPDGFYYFDRQTGQVSLEIGWVPVPRA